MGKILSRPWLLLLLAPLLYLAPILADPLNVHPAPDAEYSDLVIAHWPSAEFLRQSLLQYGEIPFWNPHTLGGTPFAADPLSGLYYPPLWLALVLPPPLAFNILFFLHLAFAGIGVYLLAREEGAGQMGALLAGIAFGGMPKVVAHIAAGHLSLVMAVSWTPWLLLAARNAARVRSLRGWALAGVISGLVFMADPRWVIPAALAAVGYAFFAGGGYPPQPRRTMIVSWIKHLAVFGGFAAAVSAVLALPMGEFVSLSTRASLPEAERAAYSLPIRSLGGLMLGGIEGYIEWVIYPGVVILLLAITSPLIIRTPAPQGGNIRLPAMAAEEKIQAQGKGWFWFILFLFSIFLSLGSNIPGLGALTDAIPALNLLRVPPRWMFLAGLALAMLAARGLTGLESVEDERGILKKGGFALAAGGLVFAVTAWIMGWPAALWQDGLMWGALGLILFVGFFSKGWSLPATSGLIVLAVIDLAVADGRMIDPRPVDPVPAAAAAASQLLKEDTGAYRVYSPSASIPPLAAVQNGLRLLDGIDPLILGTTAKTVSEAARVPLAGYSVTLPVFATGNPETDNRDVIPDWRLLGLLNVRYVASAFEIPSAMLGECRFAGGIRICRNLFAAPRAWVAEGIETWDRPIAGREARIESESPNRMSLTATGPGIVVVSEASYPAWRAAVDGEAAELITVGGWWRAAAIGPGEHVIEMAFDPLLSRIGLGITLLALLAFLGVRRWAA